MRSESLIVPGKRLGRLPHDPNQPALSLSKLLTGVVPTHPVAADHFSRISSWGMLGNDQWADCGPAMAMHGRMLIAKYLSDVDFTPTVTDTLDLYRRCGNPRFPTDDNGVKLADMLTEMETNGIGPDDARVRPVTSARVNVADLDEVRAAIAIFGDLSTGVDLQKAQAAQTDAGDAWDVANGSPEWGGHAVLTGFYTSETTAGQPDPAVISWGRRQDTTDAFWRAQAREAWVVIWPEHFGTAAFLQGVDQAALARYYRMLTGQPLPQPVTQPALPVRPPMAVIPTPAQLAANDSLAEIARGYIPRAHLTKSNKRMATELEFWMQSWNLPL